MNFHAQKSRAYGNTLLFLLMYPVALAGMSAGVFTATRMGLFMYYTRHDSSSRWVTGPFWQPELVPWVVAGLGVVMVGMALYKAFQLRHGGYTVATSMAGRFIPPDTRVPEEKRLRNVVEEMALASGLPNPAVFILDNEGGINAFAAGYSPEDAAIGITAGAVNQLNRSELQGIVAHEFSHILHADMRMNMHLTALMFGISGIFFIGWGMTRGCFHAGGSVSSRSARTAATFITAGLVLTLTGLVGMLCGKLLMAAISRQREYLADATAVELTRNTTGIAGSLQKIFKCRKGSKVMSKHAMPAAHMFFGRIDFMFPDILFSTHPPLRERISMLDPTLAAELPSVEDDMAELEFSRAVTMGQASRPNRKLIPGEESFMPMAQEQETGTPSDGHFQKLMAAIPHKIVRLTHTKQDALSLMLALHFSAQPEVRRRQKAMVSNEYGHNESYRMDIMLSHLNQVDESSRLPLIDLASATLMDLSGEEYKKFRATINKLIQADGKTDLSEWVTTRLLTNRLDAKHAPRPAKSKTPSLEELAQQVNILLSSLARAGATGKPDIQHAFEQGARLLAPNNNELLAPKQCGLKQLDAALADLAKAKQQDKMTLIAASARVIMADSKAIPCEQQLLHGVAYTLGVPVPPLES